MADVYLAVQSDKPGSSLVVLINGEPSTTGYTIQRNGGVDLGGAVYDRVYSGPRGTQGATLVSATAQNRLSTWMLQVAGTSEDDLQAKLSVLMALDEDLRHYGGTAYWRSWGSSFLMTLKVLDSGIAPTGFDPDLWVANHRMNVAFGLVTPPYMDWPGMDISDDFSTDTEANYTFDAGAADDVAITGGQLTVVANPTTEKRLIHTGVGYSYGDVQATIKATPGSTISGFLAGVVLNRWDANNYIRVYVDDNGTNSRLRIDVVIGGTVTNRQSANLGARVANGTPFWLRGRIEGVNIYAEFFTSAPSPTSAATSGVTWPLTAIEQAKFSPNILGAAGINWTPQQSAAVIDDFVIEPFTYNFNYEGFALPAERLTTFGTIPGDAPALAELFVTYGGITPWASFAWWPKTGVWNYVWNGDFENGALVSGAVPLGWSVAAVTNINGAATSINRITTAGRYGIASGQIVAPATSGTGANFRVFGDFKKGITYTAELWIHAASATTNVQVKLGNAAANDVATSGSTALSTTWQRITVSWTPTSDRDDAHIGVIIAAATATTFEIDGVMVYEGATAPTIANQKEGRGGFPPLGLIEAENSINGIVVNANFRSGFGSGANAPGPQIVIDPTLCVPDDYTEQTIAVVVWGRAELITGTTASGAILSAKPVSSAGLQPIYSDEFGNVGKTMVMPSSGTVRRFVRLGTLRLPTDGGTYLLSVESSGGGTRASWDYFALLPANASALSPTGRANDASYPDFINTGSTVTRRIRSDLSGTVKEPGLGLSESSAPGLGGSLLELPPGAVQTFVKLSSLVPDDPTSDTTTETLAYNATVHYAVTPRSRLGRSS